MNLRERKKLAVWREIRAAALHLFEARGYEATTIEQIADAANVSRATFFNYFASKESVVFDQDPEDRDNWRTLMTDRPGSEPLWDSLTAIILGFTETLRDRMPLQRRLKAQSPTLAQSSQAFGDLFVADLRAWVTSRSTGGEDLIATLYLNLVLAAYSTAYQTWRDDESFDVLLERLSETLSRARPAGAS